jgi:hypothetical protein
MTAAGGSAVRLPKVMVETADDGSDDAVNHLKST